MTKKTIFQDRHYNPMDFAIIIPTKDRPEELRRFLDSVRIQDVRPQQIVIVDGSDDPVQKVAESFDDLPIDYISVRPPGLVKQRHVGVNALRSGIPVFGFFDDDIVLEPGAFRAMANFWSKHFEEYGGFGMNIVNAGESIHRGNEWFMRFFMIRDMDHPGRVLRSCRSTPYCPALKDAQTEWLCGGATFWKREIFDKINFDSWFQGWGMSDDLEFSTRVRKTHRLAVVANARVHHLETPTRRGRYFHRGYIGALNTLRIAAIHPEYSLFCATWSWLGQGMARVVHGMLTLHSDEVMMGTGHFAAAIMGLAGRFRSSNIQVKQ